MVSALAGEVLLHSLPREWVTQQVLNKHSFLFPSPHRLLEGHIQGSSRAHRSLGTAAVTGAWAVTALSGHPAGWEA